MNVTIAAPTELHPRYCRCSRCAPWQPSRSTTADGPRVTLWAYLGADESPPEGWQRAGTRAW